MDNNVPNISPPISNSSLPSENNTNSPPPQKKFILFFLLFTLAILGLGTFIFFRINSKSKPQVAQPIIQQSLITATPIQTKTLNNKILFISKEHGLATANPDGTNIQPLTISISKTNGSAIVSPDKSKVLFTSLNSEGTTVIDISHEIINLSSNSSQKIDIDKIRKSAGNYKYILFHEWLPDNVSVLFQATNTLADQPEQSEQYVGIYNSKTLEIKKLFIKNAKYLGNFTYDEAKQKITYYEGWGSSEALINDFDLKTGTHSQVTVIERDQERKKILEKIVSTAPADTKIEELAWSKDDTNLVVTSEKTGATPVTNLNIYKEDGTLISSTDISDYNKIANTINPNSTPQGGIFSPDNKYFLYESKPVSDFFKKTSWQVIEVKTGKVNSDKITSESLGRPILWIN